MTGTIMYSAMSLDSWRVTSQYPAAEGQEPEGAVGDLLKGEVVDKMIHTDDIQEQVDHFGQQLLVVIIVRTNTTLWEFNPGQPRIPYKVRWKKVEQE